MLFAEIEQLCKGISAQGHLQIKCGSCVRERNQTQTCILTDQRMGMNITWYQQYSNILDNAFLSVREFKGVLILPQDIGRLMYSQDPKLIRETKYLPQLSGAREYGWGKDEKSVFLSSSALAEACVILFMDIAKPT